MFWAHGRVLLVKVVCDSVRVIRSGMMGREDMCGLKVELGGGVLKCYSTRGWRYVLSVFTRTYKADAE